MLPSQVEETEMTLMRRTGCAKRAWHRNALPGAGRRELTGRCSHCPGLESSSGCKLKKGNFWLDVKGGNKKIIFPSFRTAACSSWWCSQEELKLPVVSKLRETIVFHL